VQQRHLAHDRPGANLGHRLAIDLQPQHPIKQQEQLLTLLALLDQGPPGLQPSELRLGVDDGHRQLALQRRLHRGHDRARVLGTPGRVGAERLPPPGVVVDEPALGDRLADLPPRVRHMRSNQPLLPCAHGAPIHRHDHVA
jgi:hypothetical protein